MHMTVFQNVKGKGKCPAKESKASDDEPEAKKSKKDDSESEDSNVDNADEEETDFSCATSDK